MREAWSKIAPQLSEVNEKSISDNDPIALGQFLEYLCASYLATELGHGFDPAGVRFHRRRWH